MSLWSVAQHHVTECLAARLEEVLPGANVAGWWSNLVIPALTEAQRITVQRRDISRLRDLDLAALLSVAIANVHLLREAGYKDEAFKPRLIDVKAARNRHAHAPASGIDSRTTARDLHNCQDVLRALRWTETALSEVDAAWREAAESAVKDPVSPTPPSNSRTPAEPTDRNDRAQADPAWQSAADCQGKAPSGFAVIVQEGAVVKRLSDAMASQSYVGIDFGTSTTVASLARFDPEARRISVEPLAIRQVRASGQGLEDHIVPTCIALRSGKVLYGHGAAELKPELKSGSSVFSSFKMELGVDLGPSYLGSKLDGLNGRPMVRKPQDAARVFLEWLRHGMETAVAERGLPGSINYTVSVPASFEANQRSDLSDVLAAAGYPMDRLGFVDEPNAAFLGHVAELSGRGDAPFAALGAGSKRVMVFDFGAGTCDVSILQVSQGVKGVAARNLSISRFLALGGDDIDRAVAKMALAGALRADDGRPFELTHSQQNDDIVKRLTPIAEGLKIQCNRMLNVRNVTNLEEAERLNFEIEETAISPIKIQVRNGPNDTATRQAVLRLDRPVISIGSFAAAMRPFLARGEDVDRSDVTASIHDPVDDALRKAGLKDGDLDALLFIGGSAESPLVRRALTDRFGRFVEAIVPRDLRSHVSQGAAFHCLHLHGLGVELVEPIIADAISVITLDGGLQPIVPAGTPVPSDRIEVGALRVDRHGQRIIELPFCSGDEDKLIGVLRISAADSAGFAKGERVTVSCRLTAEKLLVAEATVAGIAKGAEFMNPLANRPLSEAEQSMLRARQHFNESAASNKGRPSVSAVENYAEAAKDAGEWRIAAEMLEAAERLDPSRNHSNSIDYCWSNAGRRNLSAAWSQIAHDRNPSATTAFNLSLARQTAGETVEFVRLCREGLRREPRHLPTLNMLGRHLMDTGEPEGRSLLLRCVEIGTRLMDENEASKDDIHRLRGAAQALGLSDVVKRAAGNLARLELPLARPFDNENLVAGDSTPKIQGGA